MGISHQDGNFLLKLLNMLLCLAFTKGGPLQPHGEEVLKQMPHKIRNLLSKFDLESHTIIYMVCPACHCTYKLQFLNGPDSPIYPPTCTNIPHPEAEVCRERLLRESIVNNSSKSAKPIKPFVYHNFHDYLANLLSHSDLEFMMDKSCIEFMSTVNDKSPEFVRDIWDAEFLRSFKGPKSCHLFVDRASEGRYLFTININFFNIEGMRVQGASTSCGLISIVCINLLPEI